MPRRRYFLALIFFAPACSTPVPFEKCEEAPLSPGTLTSTTVTYHQDIRPILEARCVRCHQPGNIGPFPLTNYQEAHAFRDSIRESVLSKSMPPWLPADCCGKFRDDLSLTAEQISLVDSWVKNSAPEGDPNYPGAALPRVGGLSRVDLTLKMPEPYLPAPPPGRGDDYRCFVLDWPLQEPVFVTGLNPLPGARAIVHHLIVATVEADRAGELRELEGRDGRPGIPCEGGFGDIQPSGVLGGSLLGADYPPNIGTRIEPGTKIILNIHYSVAPEPRALRAAHGVEPSAPDQTGIELKIEPLSANLQAASGMALGNPAWFVAGAMRVEAGDPHAEVAVQLDPALFTGGGRVALHAFTPHMHALGKEIRVAIVRGEQTRCLTDIGAWELGWEQPYYFQEPVILEGDEQLQLRCAFDNSAENQPLIGGVRAEPRDIAWGSDNQDMCAGFISFTKLED